MILDCRIQLPRPHLHKVVSRILCQKSWIDVYRTTVQQDIVWESSSEAMAESEGEDSTITAGSRKRSTCWCHIKAVDVSSWCGLIESNVSARAWTRNLWSWYTPTKKVSLINWGRGMRWLTAWSNVMLHTVEAVGENLPLGESELDWAEGPVTKQNSDSQTQSHDLK